MSSLSIKTTNVFIAITLMLTSFSAELHAETAQLLLVREDSFDLTCNKSVIHGKLYGVPINFDLKNVESALGLELLTKTQELPFEDNALSRSSIPVGLYDAEIRTDATKTWMKNTPYRAWRLELKDTIPRSAIQFHYGKDYTWSRGCIILSGSSTEPLVCSENSENSSDIALQKVRTYIESIIKKSNDKITIKIINN